MTDTARRDIITKGASVLAGLAVTGAAGTAAQGASPQTPRDGAGLPEAKNGPLKRFVIEREIPRIGGMTAQQYCDIARTSDKALAQLAPTIQWEHSYVADNKTFCVYLSVDEAAIRRHGELSGFPVNKITEIDRIIDPTTAGAPA